MEEQHASVSWLPEESRENGRIYYVFKQIETESCSYGNYRDWKRVVTSQSTAMQRHTECPALSPAH